MNEAELRYFTLYEQSPDGILIIDTDGKIIEFNEAAHRQLGYSREEFARLSISDIDPFESREETEKSIRRVIEEGKAEFEVRHKTKDGDIRNVKVITQVMNLSGRRVFHTIWRDITRRKRAEDEMLESRERLSLISEASFEGIAISEKGIVIDVNPQITLMLGYDQEELIGMEVSKFVAPESRELVARMIREDFPDAYEHKALRKDGTEIFVEARGKESLYEGRKVRITAIRDITERKHAEIALKESEEKFRNLFDFATDGIFILDIKGNFIDVNKTAHSRLGYTKEEMLPLHISQLDPPEFAAIVPERLARIREHGMAVFESAHVRKDGTVMPVEVNARLLNYQGEQVYISVIRDITERKKAEKDLAEREERYRILFHESPVALWEEDMSGVKAVIDELRSAGVSDFREYFDANPKVVADCASMVRIIDVNNATLEMYKATSKDELLVGLPMIFTDESYIVFKENLVKLAEGTKLEETEAVNRRLDGHEMQILIRWDIPPEAMDTLSRVIVSTVDISGLKRLENQLKQALNEKDVLMREIHHRVKNNMQIITSLLRLQSEHVSDEKASNQLFECQNRIRSMALVHEKLYLSQNLANIDFRNYVEALTKTLRSSFGKLSHNVKVALNMDDISLNTDTSIYCGLIINELVSNSMRHAFPENNGGEIRIEARRNNDNAIELTIADDGVGIPQGIDLRKPGSLGLELVMLIAKSQLGGEIVLNKTRGTEFRISFKELNYPKKM